MRSFCRSSITQINILLFFLVWILPGCGDNARLTKENPQADQTELSITELEHELINALLPKLIPSKVIHEKQAELWKAGKMNDSTRITLFIGERMLVADSADIETFIRAGADKSLRKISRKYMISRTIGVQKIHDFNQVKVVFIPPLSSEELMHHIGGVNFSRIAWSKDRKQAAFIFDYEWMHRKKHRIFCAVKVKIRKGKWMLVSKTNLDKYPAMLYDQFEVLR